MYSSNVNLAVEHGQIYSGGVNRCKNRCKKNAFSYFIRKSLIEYNHIISRPLLRITHVPTCENWGKKSAVVVGGLLLVGRSGALTSPPLKSGLAAERSGRGAGQSNER